MTEESSQDLAGSGIDVSVPHSARIWNYWLGGEDNYEVDRVAGDAWVSTHPGILDIARGSRAFLARAVQHLVDAEGVRQFLDLGTGLPAADNVHEVAQRNAPDARVVYVDNDPLIPAHARRLLTSTPEGATVYLDADMRDSAKVIADAGRTLDLSRPVALVLQQVLGHLTDDDEALTFVREYVDALPSGSFLVISDGFEHDAAMDEAGMAYARTGAAAYIPRTPDQVARFFDGLERVEPGFVPVDDWRPPPTDGAAELPGAATTRANTFGGVGRKA